MNNTPLEKLNVAVYYLSQRTDNFLPIWVSTALLPFENTQRDQRNTRNVC